MLTAVLQRVLGESYPEVAGQLRGCDLFLNVPGGLRLLEAKQADPTADLAVGAALLSSALGKAPPTHTIFLGEISLTGQLRRSVGRTEQRLLQLPSRGGGPS